jgi:hypothetical protein
VQVTCECGCGKKFEAQRSTARFSSATCRKRASRAPNRAVRTPKPKPKPKPKRAPAPAAPRAKVKVVEAPPPIEPVVELVVDEPAPEEYESDFVLLTRQELTQLGRLDTMLGQQVLIVARRMSNGAETGSALATLSKEHSRLMAALGAGGKQADPVDEVTRRREDKRARATSG